MKRQRTFTSLLPHVGPLIFVGVVAAASLFGLQAARDVLRSGDVPGNPAVAPDSEHLRVRLEEIRWTLQIVVVAAGLFAAAQAGFSYLNAQAFTKQAEDAVKRIESLREDLEKRFPNFMEAEQMEREAGRTLEELGRMADWRGSYESLELRRRQRLLTVDTWVALDMRPKPDDGERYGRSLYRMAMLYASKFSYNRSRGGGSAGDVERAEYYLRLASDYLGETHYILNELGLLYLEFYSSADPRVQEALWQEAERLFTLSTRVDGGHQRAWYNLGVLAGNKRGDWRSAAGHYRTALQHAVWEQSTQPRPEKKCDILYNLACACTKVGEPAQAVEHLAAAAKLGLVHDSQSRKDFYDQGGDFWDLMQSPEHGPKLREVLSRVDANAAKATLVERPGTTLLARVQNAWKALTDSA